MHARIPTDAPPPRKFKAAFISPMLLLAASALPEGTDRDYEVKLDGDRALAIKSGGRRRLRSRNNKDFVGNIRSSPAERS